MVSRGDFCFAVEAGVVICRLRFQSLSGRLSSASGKCCYLRDVQPRPRELIVNLRSLQSKMAPGKGFYVFARCLNLDLTSKNSLCAKRTCLHHKPDTDGFFFEEKSDGFSEEVVRVEIGSCLADCFIFIVAKLSIESGGFFIWFAGRIVTLTSWQD